MTRKTRELLDEPGWDGTEMTEPGGTLPETIQIERRYVVGTVVSSIDGTESMIHAALRMIADKVVDQTSNMTTGTVVDAFNFTYRDHEFTVRIEPADGLATG